MLKRFILRNYRNFKNDICLDLENGAGYQFNTDCITDGIIGKAIIYGRNATGKTNFGKALMDIYYLLCSELIYVGDGTLLNADSTENSAFFSYTFQFAFVELTYRYERCPSQGLQREELLMDGTMIFRCDFEKKEYDFGNLKIIGAETASTERYLQSLEETLDMDGIEELRLPFFRWLIGNVAFKNDSVLIKFSNYVRRMNLITVGNMKTPRLRRRNDSFYEMLENTAKLRDLEDFFNAMGIECRLVLKKLPDGQRELYFDHEKLVPFYENASSGTLALFDLYRRLVVAAGEASFVYLDEFDAFYHYEMAENVIKFLKRRYPKSQILMTSHNTNLMTNRLMRPDCVFILSGIGTLTALCDATERELREGHNLEKMYISGEFEKYE